ncbi:AMP-binding protein [Spirulina sp. CCNP1310]|nr:AMP-binding protein [Spirulina sp. CCNP1310]
MQDRRDQPWLQGADQSLFYAEFHQACDQLTRWQIKPRLCLAEPDPRRFLAQFCAAVVTETPVFLCNPRWQAQEWQTVHTTVQPELIWPPSPSEPPFLRGAGGIPLRCEALDPPGYADPLHKGVNSSEPPFSRGAGGIHIPTGGSSGQIRFTIHTWETLTAAVDGLYTYFDRTPLSAYCILPLYHVSGLMQAVRSLLTGGQLWLSNSKTCTSGDWQTTFISLVPTQLQRFLTAEQAPWLQQFRAIFLGGAPAWPDLLTRARALELPLAPTYGMTETAAQIATLKPADFLAGIEGCGPLLPHARVTLTPDGRLQIQARSLCLGYYPNPWPEPILITDDLGRFSPGGSLLIQGRQSRQIITGGENVAPEEIEAAILATGKVRDVTVVGIADEMWGEAIAALYAPQLSPEDLAALQAQLRQELAPHKQPKQWQGMAKLPRNAQGKLDYRALGRMWHSH